MKNSVIKCLILLELIIANKHLPIFKNALTEVVVRRGIGNGVFSKMKRKVFGLSMERYWNQKLLVSDILKSDGQNFLRT